MPAPVRTSARSRGFTLVEMVLVISLLGLIAALVMVLASRPLAGYAELQRRAELTHIAQSVMHTMARDIRSALPNSLRISGNALELIRASGAYRYRAQHSDQAGSDILDFTQADSSFQVLGAASLPAGSRLVILHTGQSGADAYAGDSVITPATTALTVAGGGAESLVTLSAPQQFPFASPRQRVYVIDTPVSYLCDTATGQLTRYQAYALLAAQPTSAAVAPLATAARALTASKVTACSFSYSPGTPARSALVTLAITVSDGTERVRLLEQVHVNNGI
ncbi:MAG: prepilin-type N-terminal cleavage/methylation protein [Moraxellaceae bacterium]|nr:prepilin-type N-terminal cleavage/methylation protein [Moraxellaceae bacterium]